MKKLINKIKSSFKSIKNEFKEIKWLAAKDIVKQTLFSFGVIAVAMAIYMSIDTGIQIGLSYLIK